MPPSTNVMSNLFRQTMPELNQNPAIQSSTHGWHPIEQAQVRMPAQYAEGNVACWQHENQPVAACYAFSTGDLFYGHRWGSRGYTDWESDAIASEQAAVVQPPDTRYLLCHTDVLKKNDHFDTDWVDSLVSAFKAMIP